MLTIAAGVAGDTLTITLRGDLDLSNCLRLPETVREHATPAVIVIDLAGVDFCDSSGLGVLVQLHKAAEREGRRLVLRAPTLNVRRLFDVAGLSDVFVVE